MLYALPVFFETKYIPATENVYQYVILEKK